MKIFLKCRRSFVVGLHVALIVLANYLAFWLRFDGEIPDETKELCVQMLPWLLVIRGLGFIPFRLYEGVWRYTGIWDLRNIVVGVVSSTVLFYGMVRWGFSLYSYPLSVFLIDTILLIFFLGGIRLVRRIYRELDYTKREKLMLIYGAGDAGEMIVRDMKNNAFYEYEPIGFIDDDPNKVGHRIHGVKVLGTRDDLCKVMNEVCPQAILVAMPKTDPATVRRIVKALEPFKVPIKTLPNLRDLLGGYVEVSQIRNLLIEDLLERAPIGLNSEPLRHLIQGKRVLVTGAGGSIGSELCRQICRLQPSSLILFERYENSLYAIASELAELISGYFPIVGDITDEARVSAVFEQYRPQIIFHAAAHKHVPLMEPNPCEAIKNNIRGTRIMAQAAKLHGAERFILVSTDKAVNPTSVMGATKRAAELVIKAHNDVVAPIFSCVRFGNVLGSNGSVIPRFIQQIKAGGPVTVTHPEMRRYFMLIPEAVQLVLHAASMAKGGETFVLDMGEQIRVVDLARNLIRFSGYVPEEEIPIIFTGLRPGEKLYEELVCREETVEPTAVEKILLVRAASFPNISFITEKVAELERWAAFDECDTVIDLLCQLVPNYSPSNGHSRRSQEPPIIRRELPERRISHRPTQP